MILRTALACVVASCGGKGSPSPRGGGGQGLTLAVPAVADASTDTRHVLLFFGTSVTAGLGLEPDEAFPALIQQKIDSATLPFRVVNGGVSGETSAAGRRRIDWLLQQPVDVLVLELGANDALRGQDLTMAKANLQVIINRTRARYPRVRVVVAGMEAPPNLGRRYTREFRALFTTLARQNHATLIPFLLDSVAGVPELNQADGIHPTAAGARVVANNVWRVLEPLLRGTPRP